MIPSFLKNNNIYLLIGALSLVQVLYTWGKLAIGGDVMIPFSAEALEKYLYQWQPIQNGLYFSLNYLPFYLYYSVAEFFNLSVYQISFLLLFLINFLGGVGVYKALSLFSPKEEKLLYLVPILLYMFSPALLNGWHYMYFYGALPWFFFLLFKVIKRNTIESSDIIGFVIVIFFSSLDLPNPKYLFHLFLVATVSLSLALAFGLIQKSFFTKNWRKFVFLALASAYLIVPLVFFATHYAPENYGVHTQAGYKDSGRMMDSGSTTVDKMFRLYHDGINLNEEDRLAYFSGRVFVFFSFTFIVIVFLNVCWKKQKDEEYKYNLILLVLCLVFLFFAVGPNPPFGMLYQYLVRGFPLFAFLRTTAGAVFLLSFLYTLALFNFLKSLPQHQRTVSIGVGLAIFLAGYPIFNGTFYKNNSAVNEYASEKEHGLRVPTDYFAMKQVLDQKRLDAKILVPRMGSSYMSTEWGYFGPLLYNFLYKNTFIPVDKVYTNIYNHNIRYIFQDDSLYNREEEFEFQIPEKNEDTAEVGMLALHTLSSEYFVPHVFIPKKVLVLQQNSDTIRNTASTKNLYSEETVFFKDQPGARSFLIESLESKQSAGRVIEFKKINPTKYRIKIHNASGIFPVVFSENFDEGWRAYMLRSSVPDKNSRDRLPSYRVWEGNEGDQASVLEVADYLEKGWVTTLGEEKERGSEGSRVEFISKNFQGTLQNDNLPAGHFWETWFKAPLEAETTHVIANGFANSWILDAEKLCGSAVSSTATETCSLNADGTYELEMVIEFWPQQIYYFSAFLSLGVSMFGLCSVFFALKKRYSSHDRRGLLW